ncbi:MAG: glycosyltransferase family 9 protein [Planctomycetota bacterium]|nr:glycosyltransferase family 9 protein [Planctomycetota bacterium]
MTNKKNSKWTVNRHHGLGDVVLLLPLLNKLLAQGTTVSVGTRPEWANIFQDLVPEVDWVAGHIPEAADLDAMTKDIKPEEHRTDEFGRLLKIPQPFEEPFVKVPEKWKTPFSHLSNCTVFAPEAEHVARRAPETWAVDVAKLLRGRPSVLVGNNTKTNFPADHDYRGRTSVQDLFAILAVAGTVLCMDSGVLHLAAAVGVPTIAVFGGVTPEFRIRKSQKVLALQADIDCCPCNKNESCNGLYQCLTSFSPANIITAIDYAPHLEGLKVIRTINELS